ncbi:MAG: PVC-type heme-binding CxxCH protein, partial [Verrucomicrobiota bacterium]
RQSMRWLFQCLSVVVCFNNFSSFAQTPKFEIADGDHIAFVGGVFAERENESSEIELMLSRHFPGKDFAFRNFGWGGDTVSTFIAPAFEPRPKYVPTLFDYIGSWKPTVLFVSYGMMESFDGEKGLADFTKNYTALLDKFSALARSGQQSPQIILIAPFHHEDFGQISGDAQTHNRNLALYVNAIAKMAQEKNCRFVNLFELLESDKKNPVTSNGVHLNSYGYERAAAVLEKSLGLSPVKIKSKAEEALRAALKTKNLDWWHHYRPMNSEYVYPQGTRFQDKIGDTQQPLDQEIARFAQLAKQDDEAIAALRMKWANGEKVALSKATKPSASSQSATNFPDPEIERKTFQVADGFEVNLFAADPAINKPIQMAFDERGRLFVATTTLYPQIKPGERPTDKIIVLEDTDGDGRADRTKVFADGLLIPTGILPDKDGAYVFDDTTLLRLRDKDGNGRADGKEIVFSGFGTEDSHHKGHVLRYSPGGNIYFNQGVFLHSVIETPRGIVHQSGNWLAGIFEYQPTTGIFDVYLASSLPPNPWGHYWNYWGFDFHIDSSAQYGSNFILPTANKTSIAIPVVGGEGKLAGGEIISGRHFPDAWQGNFIAAPFKENRVARWSFSDDGSGYTMKQLDPLIVSTDPAFRPVDMKMGPDGALYIADWYNLLIGHMQYHFRDPGRDFTHGRIWRVTAKNRPLAPKFDFAKASVKEVLDQLKAPEEFNRAQAKRVLSGLNPKKVLPALAAWVKNLNPADKNFDHQRLEALWTYQTLNVVEPALMKSLLRAKEPDARAAATAVLRYWRDRMENVSDLLAVQVADENPRVRLQAVISLSYLHNARAMEIAASVLDHPMDKYLEQALKNTANALQDVWLSPAQKGDLTFGGNTKHLDFALNAVGAKKIENPVAKENALKQIALSQALEKKSQTPSISTEIKDMSRAEMEPWVREVQTSADAARGEKIFHRADLNCFACHAIGGAGGQVGPELGAVGSGSTIDYLIESILFPNKVIKDGFQTVEVTTKDDDSILGVRVRETAGELVLKDVTRNEIIIPLNSIKEKKEKQTSLMPSGLTAPLTHAELMDLVRFLSELGKPGAYANNPKTFVRSWKTARATSDAVPSTNLPWTTTYSFVSGILPLEALPTETAFARFDLDVTTGGKIKLNLNSTKGLKLWVDAKSVELNSDLELAKGKHQLTFAIDARKRKDGLSVNVEEAAGSPAKFQLIATP